MTFMIKPLGDYTCTLPDRLKLGDAVEVEGPYGRFDFADANERQIWVAGGIGITPFIARLEALAGQPAHAPVDLFYSTRQPDEGFIASLRQLADKARVRLHVLVADRDGRLDADGICRTVPEWPKAGLWFCGPAGFGNALRQALGIRGFGADRFHQELFDMR
jgi:predicted ferric reductase